MSKVFLLVFLFFINDHKGDFHKWENFAGSKSYLIIPAQEFKDQKIYTTAEYLVVNAENTNKASLIITNTEKRGPIHIKIPITLPYNQLIKLRLNEVEELRVEFDSITTGNFYVSGFTSKE